ncbi:MAG TPA: hypothetical protein VMF07_03525 [Solirubrobacteraceae bacterium]|nr:hypothetical protein [Solirubrobacteraceae bacterium]
MSRRRHAFALALALLLAAGLSECAVLGGGAPGAGPSSAGPSSARPSSARPSSARPGAGSVSAARRAAARTVARADRTHEVPTPAPRERVPNGWATPEQAVRAFAAAYVNWTAATVSARLQALARRSVGQARATLELQAREVAADRELHRGQIANAGTVEAVGALSGSPHQYAVVTREHTSAADDAAYRGLAPEWHVSVATVTLVGRRWVLSGWQPES